MVNSVHTTCADAELCCFILNILMYILQDLEAMAEAFTVKRKAGTAQAHGSGFGGSGFKFDAAEEQEHKAERKVCRCSLVSGLFDWILTSAGSSARDRELCCVRCNCEHWLFPGRCRRLLAQADPNLCPSIRCAAMSA